MSDWNGMKGPLRAAGYALGVVGAICGIQAWINSLQPSEFEARALEALNVLVAQTEELVDAVARDPNASEEVAEGADELRGSIELAQTLMHELYHLGFEPGKIEEPK